MKQIEIVTSISAVPPLDPLLESDSNTTKRHMDASPQKCVASHTLGLFWTTCETTKNLCKFSAKRKQLNYSLGRAKNPFHTYWSTAHRSTKHEAKSVDTLAPSIHKKTHGRIVIQMIVVAVATTATNDNDNELMIIIMAVMIRNIIIVLMIIESYTIDNGNGGNDNDNENDTDDHDSKN